MKMACSFHDPQVRRIRRRSVPRRADGDVELRQVRIRLYGRVSFPEDVKLSLRVRDRQSWRKDAVIVVAVDPDRALRRIVAIAGGSAPPLGDVGCAGSLQGARQQMNRDVGRLPIDGGTAGVTVASLPALDEGAVLGQADAFEIGRRRDTAGGCLSDDLEFRFTKTASQHRNVEAGGRGGGMKSVDEIVA